MLGNGFSGRRRHCPRAKQSWTDRMTQTPTRIGPRTYDGPPTIEGLTTWVEQIVDDQERALRTNLQLAFESGDLATDDDLDAALEQAEPIFAQARESVRQQIVALVARLKAAGTPT
jgi:hypothetical protein